MKETTKTSFSTELWKNLQLIPGTVLNVEFTTDKSEGVLAVPKTALFPYENGDAYG